MLIVVDANIIISDPLLRNKKWTAARDAIRAERLRLILPEVARLESVAGFRRKREENIKQVKAVLRKSSLRAKEAAETLLMAYADESDEYEAKLDTRLRQIGFEVRYPTSHDHLDVAQRAVDRIPPFDENGGGYRDTLIWLNALDAIEEAPFDNLVLVSDDGVFTAQIRVLADELRRETNAELTVVRSLAAVEMPGEFEAGEFDLDTLNIDTSRIVARIRERLVGRDISALSPPSLDHAEVRVVDRVDLLVETARVRKRYGSTVYEVSMEAVADTDAEVLVIHDAFGSEVDFSQMSARWNLHVLWRGDVDRENPELTDDDTLEVLKLTEHRKGLR